VPLIPTTLSVRTYQQLLTFLKQDGRYHGHVSAFFSMVDKRKNLHKEMVTTLREEYENFLSSTIPYLSQIEKMGIYREPIPAFAPGSDATQAYEALWVEIQANLNNKK
jgi:cellulose biosynthesis protein BcsQ